MSKIADEQLRQYAEYIQVLEGALKRIRKESQDVTPELDIIVGYCDIALDYGKEVDDSHAKSH